MGIEEITLHVWKIDLHELILKNKKPDNICMSVTDRNNDRQSGCVQSQAFSAGAPSARVRST
jgi:hypothetical protein